MNNIHTSKILSTLKKHSGKNIPYKDFLKELQTSSEKKVKNKQNKKNVKEKFPEKSEDLRMILAELALYGLIKLEGKYIHIKHPFMVKGKISMSPRGVIFAMVKHAAPKARDLFIPAGEHKNSLPGDEVDLTLIGRSRDRFEAHVTNITSPARTLFRMKLMSHPKSGAVVGSILDLPNRLGAVLTIERMPHDLKERLKPETVVVVMLSGREMRYMGTYLQEAHFVRFENDTDMDIDYARILMKHGLDPIYPSDIELPSDAGELNETNVKDWKQRTDLRELYTITIDGAESKDFDDAISVHISGKNRIQLYVHIADVSYYVKSSSALDAEAYTRATSFYLANRVVPMLPPILSENLCSLIAGHVRLAFTAEMEFDTVTGEMKKSNFYKSLIKVDQRYTYDNAEKELNFLGATLPEPSSKKNTPALEVMKNIRSAIQGVKSHPELLQMWELAKKLRTVRIRLGSIDLDIPESKIKYVNDIPDIIETKPRLKSSMLIEEFMLAANRAVASFLKTKNVPVLYRIHESMDESKLEMLNGFFKIYDIPLELKRTDQKGIRQAMDTVKKSARNEMVQKVFHLQLLRTFMQARYQKDPLGHWGLAFKDYCHFTSPIRRYPDLVVHRVLDALIHGKKFPYTFSAIEEMGYHTSEQERKAMDAEREMTRLKMIRYIQKTGQTHFTGFISGFKSDRLFVELIDLPVEGNIEAVHLTDEGELVLPDKFSVFLKKFSRPAFLGEVWSLELDRIDIEDMRIYLKPDWKKTKGKQKESAISGKS